MADRGRIIFFPILDKEGLLLGREKKNKKKNVEKVELTFDRIGIFGGRTISVYYSRPKERSFSQRFFLLFAMVKKKKAFRGKLFKETRRERKGTTTTRINFIDARSGLAFRPNRWPVEEPRR